jgi:hypothetical protein
MTLLRLFLLKAFFKEEEQLSYFPQALPGDLTDSDAGAIGQPALNRSGQSRIPDTDIDR